jgi:hypothetical protein
VRVRSALLVALILAGCANVSGTPAETCDGTWRGVESIVAIPDDAEARPLPVTCIRQIDDKRIRIGFSMPPGPTCYVLDAVQVAESADSVSVRLMIRPNGDPAAGACADRPGRTTTEIDLQAPIADRQLLDAAAP